MKNANNQVKLMINFRGAPFEFVQNSFLLRKTRYIIIFHINKLN